MVKYIQILFYMKGRNMAKNFKLNTKNKQEADGRFYINGGFFRRYTCTRNANIAIMVLQALSLALTAIFALCLGVFGSLVMMGEGFEGIISTAAGYIESAVTFWLISSIVYVIGTFILFLGFSRVASVIHGAALVMTIIMYALFRQANASANIESSGPAMIYMPCILIALISLAVAMIVHIPVWLDKKTERENEQAPSILADDKED